jgi:hypothetical protein
MSNWFRYGYPRRYVMKLTGCLPINSWMRERLLEWLYPSDCVVRFK